MNNKGFAVTTIVYSVILLLALIMFTTIALVDGEYNNQKDFVNDINESLGKCLNENQC